MVEITITKRNNPIRMLPGITFDLFNVRMIHKRITKTDVETETDYKLPRERGLRRLRCLRPSCCARAFGHPTLIHELNKVHMSHKTQRMTKT